LERVEDGIEGVAATQLDRQKARFVSRRGQQRRLVAGADHGRGLPPVTFGKDLGWWPALFEAEERAGGEVIHWDADIERHDRLFRDIGP